MAGTIFGLPLSQRVDLNGQPSVGWLLYVYQANTSTPAQSYQDTALTILNPWPIPADAYGMMRPFWLADGNYRARATSADGSLTYFDQFSILALGASSGAAPSGGVDPTTIYQTGDTMWLDRSGVRTGWVRDNGNTLGSATSGGSERANADAQPLFEFLWNNFSDTFCPVVSGRGASSLADWTANKRITLPDKRGCSVIGADAMGGISSGKFTVVPVVAGAIDTPGSTVGGNGYQLLTADLPSHTHTATVTDGGHSHGLTATTQTFGPGASTTVVSGSFGTGVTAQGVTLFNPTNITVANANAGSDGIHNTVQRSIIGTWFRKL